MKSNYTLVLFSLVLALAACSANKEALPGSYKLEPSSDKKKELQKTYGFSRISPTQDKTKIEYSIKEIQTDSSQNQMDSHEIQNGKILFTKSRRDEKIYITLMITSGELTVTNTRSFTKAPETPQSFTLAIAEFNIQGAYVCSDSECANLRFVIESKSQKSRKNSDEFSVSFFAFWELVDVQGNYQLQKLSALKKPDYKTMKANPYYILTLPQNSAELTWFNF